ncbi:MAG TPA: PfkB family carbohydrate kinase [Clostridia bacterium]|nr:PfkB family carbohydrate kinase [Clostridia bacterium]
MITPARFDAIVRGYPNLRIALLGDFCLDRYLEIDPARQERSIETGLPVHNVVRVRPQPGGAGTILNNLDALGIGTIFPIGFAGEDGEGFELVTCLRRTQGVQLSHFIQTPLRRTFTYCKPLLMHRSRAPEELSRLDTKNWTPTPDGLSVRFTQSLCELAQSCQAMAVLDQVDLPDTGVVTEAVRASLGVLARQYPQLLITADSRQGLKKFPPLTFKMNAAELAAFTGEDMGHNLDRLKTAACDIARCNGRAVFITLAEQGMIGALPDGEARHVPALPVRGEIDVVGAGDAVTANLVATQAAGATLVETLEMAVAAASVVIHKLGTTGSASVGEIRERLFDLPR